MNINIFRVHLTHWFLWGGHNDPIIPVVLMPVLKTSLNNWVIRSALNLTLIKVGLGKAAVKMKKMNHVSWNIQPSVKSWFSLSSYHSYEF